MVESIELLAQEAMRGMVLGIYVACDGQYLLMDVIDDDMYLVEIASNTIVRKINVGEAKNRQIYTYCEYSQKLNIRVDRKLYTLNLKTLDCKYILNLEDYSLNSVDVYTNNDGYIYIMQNQLDENVKQNTDRLKVFVYDPESMKIINQFYCPKIDNVYRNVLTPDGRQILLGDSLLDIDTGNFVTKFATNTKKLKSPIFSPDGKTILSYSDNFVTFWDVRTGQSFYSITCEANCDFELIFSPNGSKCAFASRNGEICVWDFISPQALINHCRELYDGVDLTDDEKRSLYIES
jgi:WD40 repeat protein